VLDGFADGLLVESHLGRPTKVEGNPRHPSSVGGTDAFAQASVLTLYDPGRAQTVTSRGRIRPWTDFVAELNRTLDGLRGSGGQGLRFLAQASTSPTLKAQRDSITGAFPQARWHTWEPINRDNVYAGTQLAFGQTVEPRYHFDAADVVLGLDADPFAWGPGHLRYVRDAANRRRPEPGRMSRVYAVESTPSQLGTLADHRLPLPARAIQAFSLNLAAGLGVDTGLTAAPPAGVPAGWLEAVAADLRGGGQNALVVPGDSQPPLVHALAHAINVSLGAMGTTVEYADPVEVDPSERAGALSQLVADMAAGQVTVLVILGGNPAFDTPADVPFATNLSRVGLPIYLGLFENETAEGSQWHIPELHALEAWSDARAYDGTTTILQPLIAPLYPEARSAHELLAVFTEQPEQSSHDVVKGYWQSQHQGDDFQAFWRTSLHDGVVADTAQPAKPVTLQPGFAAGQSTPSAEGLEIVYRPDPSLYDGRFASNGWLLELPRPLTKLTWDNVALLSPATAARLGIQNEDVVELAYAGRSVRAPVSVLPGQADDSVCVTLGYGRRRGAGPGTGVGFNAYGLRTLGAAWFDRGLDVRRTGQRVPLASTQGHYTMEGRDLVRTVFPDRLTVDGGQPPPESIYPRYPYPSYAWGMVIDLSACVGCNACVAACQAENNIPVVGKEEVGRGREMHWLRVDTYFEGSRILNQLVPCMQCETAPCELVCPVGATVHSDEGLNDMVYNRCVGTRYCSNNCPYKVRHFNFFEYADFDTSVLKLLRNPDVTVRSRGVMEKCTYCVQRITQARIHAEKENRPIRDGEVLTACQAACPSNAIVFGNLNDPSSGVARQRALPRNYTMLAELNTRPRTTYLATVHNPNPAMGTDAG
jgi:molybdopterin-containing oxidoreductase family iron-sulfur binding subunit